MKKFDLLITGVGGQGNILASDVVGEVAMAAGYDVKKTDTLGMAQRGGSVISHVRISRQVFSPLIRAGEVDILLAFEKLEAARWASYLRADGIAIINNQTLPPLSVSTGSDEYPSDKAISAIFKQRTERVYFVEATKRAKELGNVRTLNIFMLGCLSVCLPFQVGAWKYCVREHLAPSIHQINMTAFDQGRKELRDVIHI